MDLTDLAMTGATSETEIRRLCRQLPDIADPIDEDLLWLWCRNFAPIMAVSLARLAARPADIRLVRELGHDDLVTEASPPVVADALGCRPRVTVRYADAASFCSVA